jgi:hypothetical protein
MRGVDHGGVRRQPATWHRGISSTLRRMGIALTFDSTASPGVLREKGASTAELLDDLAATLRLHRWPAIDLRLLILPAVEGTPPLTSYLALRGTFAEKPHRVELVWADPPMWRGAITNAEAIDLLLSWVRALESTTSRFSGQRTRTDWLQRPSPRQN